MGVLLVVVTVMLMAISVGGWRRFR